MTIKEQNKKDFEEALHDERKKNLIKLAQQQSEWIYYNKKKVQLELTGQSLDSVRINELAAVKKNIEITELNIDSLKLRLRSTMEVFKIVDIVLKL